MEPTFSGHSILDAGKINAPYIPMQTTPTLLGPPEPTIVERVAALDEQTGGPARKMIADWEKFKVEEKTKAEDAFALRRSIRTRIKKKLVVMPNSSFFGKCDVTSL